MKKLLLLALTTMAFTQSSSMAVENKIKFNEKTYNLHEYTEKPMEYEYFTANDTPEKWQTRISLSNLKSMSNTTEACADLAHQIQEQTPGASVLVYPDISMVEYINFPEDRKFYEYSAIIFQPPAEKGVDMFKFSKRFYSDDLESAELARDAAVAFATENSTKYMQMVNTTAPKYKFD